MDLQTKISLKPEANNQIDYNSIILLLGSCFIENIGGKLDYFKFQNTINPFGILFHPKAIETLITNAINEKLFTDKDIFFHNECWHCFEAHSKISNTSKEKLLYDLNSVIQQTNQSLKEATHIVITLGTAWVYKHIERKTVVANCHKVPQKQFTRTLLSIDDITASLSNIEKQIRSVNPEVQIIYTVSPVRHLKDGFIENTQSKSHLISAVHQFLIRNSNIQNRKSVYFPSYEIMMDELRDYRFFGPDMLHPNETAINYIWERFIKVWIDQESYKIMDEVDAIQKGLFHKPFNYNSSEYQQFKNTLERKKKLLQTKYPHLLF